MLARALSRAGAPTRIAKTASRSLATAASKEVPQLEFGRAVVWGRGSLGLRPSEGLQRQLENLSVTALKPTVLNTLTDTRIEQLAFGVNGGAAVTEGGKLWTWGTNKHVLGLGGRVVAVPVPRPIKALESTEVVDVAIGSNHGAALSANGQLFTWGYGGFPFFRQGALGHGDRVDQAQPAVVEAFLEEDSDEPRLRVAQVGCGEQHTVALTEDGQVWAWGEGESGLLGSGMFAADRPRAVDFEEAGVSCVRIAVGAGFTLALDDKGQVWGWGRNGYGQLGLGEDAALDIQAAESVPTVIPHFPPEDPPIVDIAAGGRCSIALGATGKVYVWGDRIHMRPASITHFEDDKLLLEGEVPVRVAAGVNAFGVLTSAGRVFTFGKGGLRGAAGHGVGAVAGKPALLKGIADNSAARLVLGGSAGAIITGPPPSSPRVLGMHKRGSC